jgi:4-amino-4-deoxy-L-arabinose transferase-like glycosyltransferase
MTADPATPRHRRPPAVVVAGLVLFTIITRLPTLIVPQPIDDESAYVLVGNEIVQGGLPYLDAVDRKPPLLFYVYAAIVRTAGEYNWAALHALAIVWLLATMAGLYVVGRRIFGDAQPGLIAAFLYSLYQPWGLWKALAFNGEVLMLLPVVWAYAIAFSPASAPDLKVGPTYRSAAMYRSVARTRLDLLIAGALIAIGFLLKQPAAIAAVPLGVYLLAPPYRADRGLSAGRALSHAVLFTAGFAAVLGVTVLWLRQRNLLAAAYYWTITHHEFTRTDWIHGTEITLVFVAACCPLLIAAAAGARQAAFPAGRSAERLALMLWLLVSAVGTAAGGHFFPHYYIQLLPPLALLAAEPLARLAEGNGATLLPRWLTITRLRRWLALTAVAIFVIDTIGLANRKDSKAGAYLREQAPAGSRLFVWGQSQATYLEARLRPATRFITTFPLTGYQFGPDPSFDSKDFIVPGAWDDFLTDIRDHPPEFIVDREQGPHPREPVTEFPIVQRLIEQHYREVARFPDAVVYRRVD